MAIQVICPGCLTSFSVADQHAGKEGPCPKCKKKITIPEIGEEVVIHAPGHEGPTDSKGRSVLKTVRKKDAGFNPLIATGVGVTVLLTLLAAFLLRGNEEMADSWKVLASGSIILGPLLAWAGYSFLRDQELEPYMGNALWGRAAVCGLAFALAWFVYVMIAGQIGESDWREAGLALWQMGFALAVAMGIGSLASFVTLDLEPIMAFVHCSLYFIVTVLLRFVMALPPLPGLVPTD